MGNEEIQRQRSEWKIIIQVNEMSKLDEVRLGFETAYIDGSVVSSDIYRPQFVSINHKEGKKVLSSIEDELLACESFQIMGVPQKQKDKIHLKD